MRGPRRPSRLGFDTRALLLVTVVLVLDSGDDVIIYAMPARKSTWTSCPGPGGRTCEIRPLLPQIGRW